jgi:hypothetical protein
LYKVIDLSSKCLFLLSEAKIHAVFLAKT